MGGSSGGMAGTQAPPTAAYTMKPPLSLFTFFLVMNKGDEKEKIVKEDEKEERKKMMKNEKYKTILVLR